MSGGFIYSLYNSLFKKKEEEEEPSKIGLARVFKYDVLKQATNSFSTEIGNGGFGRVYLGKLPDGQQVAVKVLYDRNPKRIEEFCNEIAILSPLRHKNLVTLYGCTNPHNQELLLVYDYVPNGTVADHLHGQQSNLNWAARVQIAVETAEALRYLHGLEPPIIHRDVKTSNILLDHDFHVKVADLGMCRLLPYDATHVSTVPQGTMGYRDPEYDLYCRLTVKSDVYSFGVVLIELISGQMAVDVNRCQENIYLDNMFRNMISNKKLEELVDPKLGYQSNGDVWRMINSIANLASQCLLQKGDSRPPMAQVVTILKGIQNQMHHIGLNNVDAVLSVPQHKLNDGRLNTGLVFPAMTPTALNPELLDDIISRLLEVRMAKPGKKVNLSESEIRQLCVVSRDIFLQQPNLLELYVPVKICGDIHGQYSDLLRIFEYGGFPPAANYLFMGNYVDFGKQSTETICLLLAYKIKYPENFFLLRGNHECAYINRIYGFYDECNRRHDVRLWKVFTDCFNCLPVAALIDDKILCLHGGLSPDLKHLDQIRNLARPTDVPDSGLLCDLLWSDPARHVQGRGESDREFSYTFGPDKVSEFLLRHDLDLVCRGHQVVEDGYEFFATRQLVTLFSAPNFRGEYDNVGAMMSIDDALMCSFQILRPAEKKSKLKM